MPKAHHTALLLIDFINDLAFEDGNRLLAHARPAAERVCGIKAKARAAGMPVIYVNDNFDHWRSDFNDVVAYCARTGSPGRELVDMLAPDASDYFVLKPLHSGFYGTTLEVLLRHLGVERLILTGIATDVCVLFTANDAYMRGFKLFVPADCVAAVDDADHSYILEYMKRVLKVDCRPATRLTELFDPPDRS